MLFTEFKVGDSIYKLRLSTRDIVGLENRIDKNALLVFGENGDRVPTVSEMVTILFYSMQKYNHGINLNDAYDIFDEWLADGNAVTDFVTIIVDIYKVSGLFKDTNTEEKN